VETKQQTETTGNCLITSGLMNGVQAESEMNSDCRCFTLLALGYIPLVAPDCHVNHCEVGMFLFIPQTTLRLVVK